MKYLMICLLSMIAFQAKSHELIARGTSALWAGHDGEKDQVEIYKDVAKAFYDRLDLEIREIDTEDAIISQKRSQGLFCSKIVKKADQATSYGCAFYVNSKGLVLEK